MAKTVEGSIYNLSNELRNEFHALTRLLPLTSDFLDRKEYPKASKNSLKEAKKISVVPFYQNMIAFISRDKIFESRTELQILADKYPFHPDFQALVAVQRYYDLVQSGVDVLSRITNVQEWLQILSRAIYNGAINFYTLAWLLEVYIVYLEQVLKKLDQFLAKAKDSHHQKVNEYYAAAIVYKTKIKALLSIQTRKRHLKGLEKYLQTGMYAIYPILQEELESAASMIRAKNPAARVRPYQRVAKRIVFLYGQYLVILSEIPLFWDLVKNHLDEFPCYSKELVLQQRYLRGTMEVTKISFLTDTALSVFAHLEGLLAYYEDTLQRFLTKGLISTTYEVDPYLRIPSLIKEYYHLIPPEHKGKYIKKAKQCLKSLMSTRVQVVSAYSKVLDLMRFFQNLG